MRQLRDLWSLARRLVSLAPSRRPALGASAPSASAGPAGVRALRAGAAAVGGRLAVEVHGRGVVAVVRLVPLGVACRAALVAGRGSCALPVQRAVASAWLLGTGERVRIRVRRPRAARHYWVTGREVWGPTLGAWLGSRTLWLWMCVELL